MIHCPSSLYYATIDVMNRTLAALAMVLGAAMLGACGQTGDLYLPEQDRVSQRR